jgi:hypothetical protein
MYHRRIPFSSIRQSIHSTFHLLFFTCSTLFLLIYYNLFLNFREYEKDREKFIFSQSCDIVKFKIITLLIGSFTIFSGICDIYHRKKSKAITKFLFTLLISFCYASSLENFSIILLIYFGLMQMFANLLALLALYTDDEDIVFYRLYMSLRIVTWTYFYFNFLPFRYVFPIFNQLHQLKTSTVVSFFIWYLSEMFSSPITSIAIHKMFHTNCHGQSSMSKCLMLENGEELKYQTQMRRFLTEIKLHQQRVNNFNKLDEPNEASRANQTMQMLKCLMTMKRKVKRIREQRRSSSSSTDDENCETEINESQQ